MKEMLNEIENGLSNEVDYIIEAIQNDYNMTNDTKVKLDEETLEEIRENIFELINCQIEYNDI